MGAKSMGRYLARRMLAVIATFLLITLGSFVLLHVTPGDPATSDAAFATSATPAELRARVRAQFGLDQPLHQRYFDWLARIVRFDFGQSFRDGRPVRDKIAERLLPTLGLAGTALFVALLIAIPVGVRAAERAGGWFDRIVAGVMLRVVGRAAVCPGYGVDRHRGAGWNLLPFVGMDSGHQDGPVPTFIERGLDVLRHGVLIGICFVYPLAAYLIRFVRDNMTEVLSADYIRAARARGVSPRRIRYRHALPNALLPLLTVMGMLLTAVLGGAVILEVMFSWPGLGLLMFDAAMQRDYPVIMGLTVLTSVAVLAATLVVDMLYTVADPRVRLT
jgi:peptide/nickel transport system permease protein